MPSSSSANRDSFIALFLQSEAALRGYIASILARKSDREDVFQEVAMVLWRNFDHYDSTRPFIPWALGITVRKLKEEWKKQSRRPEMMPEDIIEKMALAFGEMSETQPLLSDREIALRACIGALPAQSQALIQQRYFEERSVEFIASKMNTNSSALSQTLCRLRRKLGECIKRRVRSEEAALNTQPSA